MIGAGVMAHDYLKVLEGLEQEVIVIGRSEENCQKIRDIYSCEVVSGGIQKFLNTKPEIPQKVIVAVGIEALKDTTIKLLNYGITDILLEKPGVGYASEIDELSQVAKQKDARVLLAYNRRFYASVVKAMEIIKEDGGLSSFNFEFTEWSHMIGDLVKEEAEHQNWFLGNDNCSSF